MKVLKIAGWVLVGLAAATAIALALGFPVMWLWNWLMPAIFGLPAITFWQAVGLLLLSHLLLKGHTGHGMGHRHREKDKHGHWDRFARRVKSAMQEQPPRSESPATK